MISVFVDTFYWIAFTNPQDDAHERAKQFTLSAKPGAIYTTEEVLTEYLNYFDGWGSRFPRYAATNVQNMRANQMVRVIPQTAASFEVGFTLYRSRLDKGYSLTDCISMRTMQNGGITDVLTNETHFEQEGSRALLRVS